MNKDIYKILALGALTLSPFATMAGGDAPDGSHATTTQTQIRIDVDKDTNQIVLSKDDTTPDIITKAFILKHADPYEVRPYITNASSATMIDGTETRVEAARYDDGTGVLVVSAEDYRFEKQEDGSISIPELIARLDRQGLTSSSGTPKWVYYCKHESPENIRTITNTLFNSVKNGETFQAGKDVTAIDTEINAVIFKVIPSNFERLKALIQEYDAPADNVNVTVQVYEFSEENDLSVGTDYQEWVNGIGKNMLTFDTGASARYFNFNPQWTTEYLDFLVTKGKGKVVTTITGTLADGVEHTSSDAASDFLGYFDLGSKINYTSTDPGESTVAQSSTLTEQVDGNDDGDFEDEGDSSTFVVTPESTSAVSGNNTTSKTANSDSNVTYNQALDKSIKTLRYGLQIGMESAVYGKTNKFVYNISNTNLIGFASDGTPRTSLSAQTGEIMVGSEASKFVIGGVQKKELVKVVNKLPILGSIPVIGWLFSSEDEILKTSQVVTIITLDVEEIDRGMSSEASDVIEAVNSADTALGFDQYLFDDSKSISDDISTVQDSVNTDLQALIN